MLDIHPEPEHAGILVRIGQETHEVGHMDDTAYIRDVHAGRAVIASLIQQGLFAREREAVFDHILHATDADTWLAYRAERSTRSVPSSRSTRGPVSGRSGPATTWPRRSPRR